MGIRESSFSIAANVCAADTAIIAHIVPSWLRVFGARLSEVLLVIDEEPPAGRMAAHHKQRYSNRELYPAIEQLTVYDSRVRCSVLDYSRSRDTSIKWFGEPDVVRCQSGSPTFGYAYAIEEASSDIVLHLDCDMLFFDGGWVNEAIELLECESLDLLEPPKLGMNIHPYDTTISTGAFMLKRSRFFSQCLPLKAYRLDFARRLHRVLRGKPTFLSLEEAFKREKERGKIRHNLLNSGLGFSVHVYTREYASLDKFRTAILQIEAGQVPDAQISEGWNLVLDAWPDN